MKKGTLAAEQSSNIKRLAHWWKALLIHVVQSLSTFNKMMNEYLGNIFQRFDIEIIFQADLVVVSIEKEYTNILVLISLKVE